MSRAALIDGKAIAADKAAAVRQCSDVLNKEGWRPCLVSLSVGDKDVSALYVRNQARAARACVVNFEARNLDETISSEQLAGSIQGLNSGPLVHGVNIHALCQSIFR